MANETKKIDLDAALICAGTLESEEPSAAREDLAASIIRELVSELREARKPQGRRKLPKERHGINHHFTIGGHDGYFTFSTYEDGSLGEIFLRMAKAGSTLSGLMDNLALVVSLGLQHGVPLELLCKKLIGQSYEPAGPTSNSDIVAASSIVDYVFRVLAGKFNIPVVEEKKL